MARLQDEVTINGMRLRNRVALPPLTTNYGSPQGLVTDEIIQFYTVGKILAGKSSEVIPCEECMTCFATIGRGAPMACKVNRNLPGAARSSRPFCLILDAGYRRSKEENSHAVRKH